MITDWDDAYANAEYIPGAELYEIKWQAAADNYKAEMAAKGRAITDLSYGPNPREAMEIFLPEAKPKGLAVYVHGGYWRTRNRDLWLHLAAGAVDRGWAVAMPGYVLCPEASIAEITQQIAAAIDLAAEKVDGPIRITGHSAGGHLAARMGCTDVNLKCIDRVEKILPISGVHDLRPMLNTVMNDDFKMNMEDAIAESPALLIPRKGIDYTCWVGADERPEFVRQNALLANIWAGFEVNINEVVEDGLHHLSIIESLADADSALTEAFVG